MLENRGSSQVRIALTPALRCGYEARMTDPSPTVRDNVENHQFEIDLGDVHPVRPVQAAGHLVQPPSQRGHLVQPGGQHCAQLGRTDPSAGSVRRIQHSEHADVGGCRRGLGVEELDVQRAQLPPCTGARRRFGRGGARPVGRAGKLPGGVGPRHVGRAGEAAHGTQV